MIRGHALGPRRRGREFHESRVLILRCSSTQLYVISAHDLVVLHAHQRIVYGDVAFYAGRRVLEHHDRNAGGRPSIHIWMTKVEVRQDIGRVAAAVAVAVAARESASHHPSAVRSPASAQSAL